jgi:hypothetical protein
LLSLETRDICWRSLLLCIQAGSAWVFFTIFLHQIPCLTTIRPYYTWAKAMTRLIDPWIFLLWNFHSNYFFFLYFSRSVYPDLQGLVQLFFFCHFDPISVPIVWNSDLLFIRSLLYFAFILFFY